MKRTICLIFTLLFFSTSLSFAGFYKSGYTRESGGLVASVLVKDKGIYNLCVSVDFLRIPEETKVYESDEYKNLINRLQVEWKNIALNKILSSKELEISELFNLKNSIQESISTLSEQLKKKLLSGQNADVIFSISDFFLLEPREE